MNHELDILEMESDEILDAAGSGHLGFFLRHFSMDFDEYNLKIENIENDPDGFADLIRDDIKEPCEREGMTEVEIERIVEAFVQEKESGYTHSIPSSVSTDIIEEASGYFQRKIDRHDNIQMEQITNFHLFTNAFVRDEDGNEYVDVRVIPCNDHEDPYNEVVEWTIFNEKRKFQNRLCTGRTTAYFGTAKHLNDLRLILSHQEATTLRRTEKVGLHDDQIVTQDGVLGTDEPRYIYDREPNTMSRKFNLDTLDYDNNRVQEILEIVPEIRTNRERYLGLLGWWIGALQTPRIREAEDEVTQMGVFGSTGAGKTTVISALEQLIGLSGDPLSPHTTQFSLMLSFSSATNVPLWVDEYKPTELPTKKADSLHNMMRIANKGSYDPRGTKDQSEISYKLENPVLVSGEQSITRAAESRRLLKVRLRQSGRDASNWSKLSELDLSDVAPAFWSYLLDQGDDFEDQWIETREYVEDLFKDKEVEELTVTGLTQVAVGLEMYLDIADEVEADVDISQDDIDGALRYFVEESVDNHISHIDEFLRLLSTAARANVAKESDVYHITNEGSNRNNKIYIKLDAAHASVRKYIQDHNINEDVFDHYSDYRDRFYEIADEVEWIEEKNRPFSGLGRCLVLDMEKTDEEIDGFNRLSFGV